MSFSTVLKTSLLFSLIILSFEAVAQDNQTNATRTDTNNAPMTNQNNANTTTTTTTTTTPMMTTTQPIPTPAEDAIITNSVKSLIKKSKTLAPLKVDVNTTQGIVQISGNVDSDSQASSLVETAQSVVGVRDVDVANLQIKDSQQPLVDMMITGKIKGLFIREKVFGDKDIAAINLSVETNNGVVYLTGQIDNPEQVKNAIKIIESVDGVKKVEYNVKKVTPINGTSNGTVNGNDITTNGTDRD